MFYEVYLSNATGLLLPAIICIIAYSFSFKRIVRADFHYPILFLVTVIIVITMTYFKFGWLVKVSDNQKSLHFVSIYPIMVFLYLAISSRLKNIQIKPINVPWMYVGTLSSMLFSDFCFAFHSENIDFRFNNIGGAGIYDALFITPLFVVLCSVAINAKLSLDNKAVSLN